MRILMGIQRLWRGGGTESHTIVLAKELTRLGHDVSLYTFGGPWVQRARRQGLRVYVEKGNPKSYSYLSQLIRSKNFDVLHAQDATCLRVFTQSIKYLRKRPKLIFTVHGHYVAKRFLIHANDHADAIIAVSPSIRRQFPKSIQRHKVQVVDNGIQSDVFKKRLGEAFRKKYGIPTNAFVIGYSARFTFDKVELGRRIVRTLRQYSAKRANTHVVIAGRNSRAIVQPSKHVHILGHVDRMPTFFSGCDVVIATGRTAMEALFCEVPVLAIGTAGYHGIVQTKQIKQLMQSNFGDHGTRRPWLGARVHQDITSIRRKPAKYRSEAKNIRRTIMEKLSATHMAQRTLTVYRQA